MRLAAIVAVITAIGALTTTATASSAAPPSGLTAYGRIVWNLDALLHDTFGTRQVWENYTNYTNRGSGIGNYSAKFISGASSVPHVYTFATARNSSFKAVRPRRPPRIGTYATGLNVPIRIRGAYISCGHGKWLYERNGQAFTTGDKWCSVGPLAP